MELERPQVLDPRDLDAVLARAKAEGWAWLALYARGLGKAAFVLYRSDLQIMTQIHFERASSRDTKST